ncbi:MAG: response regulator [Fibrobacteres bacterium]|nr:response regulator [Fibrobacterota bacterium]
MAALRILHLEDDPFFADMVEAMLAAHGMHVAIKRAETFSGFCDALRGQNYDLILSDHEFPGGDGLKVLDLCRRECPNVPFIFLSGRLGEELAVESLKNGAVDYVLKSNMSRLIPTVVRTLNAFRETAALRAAEARIRRDRANLHGLIENTLDAIWSMDMDCKVLAFNSAASLLCMKMTGHPMVEDTCFLDLLPPAQQARWREAVARVRDQERFMEEQELEWLGKRYVLEFGFNPILSAREVTGVAVFAKDVSGRKRIEAAAARLELQRGRLEAAYLRMRLPLRALERIAGMLAKAAGDGDMQRIAEMLAKAVRRLSDLHSRAGQGEEELRAQAPADLRLMTGEDGPAGPASRYEAGHPGGTGAAGPLRILVAEDNPVSQVVVTGMLQRLGREFDLAANGKEAVGACARAAYDLVLMDCQMPEMDGPDAARAIREREAGTGRRAYIAALTANTGPGIRERCLAAGMDAFYAKPLRREALDETLAAAWRLKEESSLRI